MGLFSFLFGKKKKTAKFVIEEEDDQEQFLKSDDEMNTPSSKSRTPKAKDVVVTKKTPEEKNPEAKTDEAAKSESKNVEKAEKTVAESPKEDYVTEDEAKKAEAPKEPAKKSATKPPKTESKPKKNAEEAQDANKAADDRTKKSKKVVGDTEKSEIAVPEEENTRTVTDDLDEEAIDYAGTVAVEEGRETRNGKFDIRRGKDGRFFFCLYASNHAPIAFSQMYSTSSAAMNGINSIIANSPKAPTEDTTLKNPTSFSFPKWEIYIDKAGDFRFRLYAVNGNCICHSYHGYATKSGCKGGIESIKRFSAEAKVNKLYL